MGLPGPGNYYSWRGVTTVAVKSPACAVRPWNSAVVEVTLARLGKLLLEPTYEIVVKHGSAFDSLTAPRGHRRGSSSGWTCPAIRMFAAFAGSSAYSGTCERTPKRQVTAIIGRPFARTDFRHGANSAKLRVSTTSLLRLRRADIEVNIVFHSCGAQKQTHAPGR
jgi:hypothetical protein